MTVAPALDAVRAMATHVQISGRGGRGCRQRCAFALGEYRLEDVIKRSPKAVQRRLRYRLRWGVHRPSIRLDGAVL